MSKKNPEVSIILAVFNADKFLDRCMASIVSQDFSDRELILIDGGSTDQTHNILNKYREEIDCFIIEKDNGIYDAWNKGIANANGKWLCFIGADDYYINERSLNELIHLAKYPEVNYVCARAYKVDQRGKIVGEEGRPWNKHSIESGMRISHPGSLHHRILFEKFGYFNDTYRITGDYDFFLRASEFICGAFLNKPVLSIGNHGVSNANTLICLKETKRALITNRKNSFIRANYYYQMAILKYNFRKYFHV